MRSRIPLNLFIGLVALAFAGPTPATVALRDGVVGWRKIRLTPFFWSEAPAVGDFNRDGKPDVALGPYWFEGPKFKKRHLIYPDTETFKVERGGKKYTYPGFEGALGDGKIIDNTDVHFAKVFDFNHDGWPDILIVGMQPGHSPAAGNSIVAAWYENPGSKTGLWRRHLVAENVGNFDVDFIDLFGDGSPVLLCMSSVLWGKGLSVGYFRPDDRDGTLPWEFHAISPVVEGEYNWWTHGLGHGDINADGKIDVVTSYGWFEQPRSGARQNLWEFHSYPFAFGPGQLALYSFEDGSNPGSDRAPVLADVDADGVLGRQYQIGGSQMRVMDVNGDGRADVVMSLAAHGYGLAWWEQLRQRNADGDIVFKRHMITNKQPEDSTSGIVVTEMQALATGDIDGDELEDFVSGKRYWAHGSGNLDPRPNDPAVLYWFKHVRKSDGNDEFTPQLIDSDSGAGNQIVIQDVNGDGRPDIVVSNKKGAFVFTQVRR